MFKLNPNLNTHIYIENVEFLCSAICKIRLLQNPFHCKSEIRLQIIKLFYINLILSQKRQFSKGLLVVYDVSFEINIAFSTIGIQDQNIFQCWNLSTYIDIHFKKQLPFYYPNFIGLRMSSHFDLCFDISNNVLSF